MPKAKRLKRRVGKREKNELRRLKKLFKPFGRFPISVSMSVSDGLFDLPLITVREELRNQLNRMKNKFDSLWQKSWNDMKLAYFLDYTEKLRKQERSDR